VRRSPFGQALGRDQMFFNLETAVAKYAATGGATSPQHRAA